MVRVRWNKKWSVTKVVAKLAGTVLALYVGGEITSQVANVINNTQNQFNQGFELIGWSAGTFTNATTTVGCYANSCDVASCGSVENCMYDVTGSGILAVIGIIGLASVVMEFVKFKL